MRRVSSAEARDVQTALTDEERRAVRRKARQATRVALEALGGEARREDVRVRALAQGGFTLRELDAPAPLKAQAKFGDAVEHALAWALTDLKRAGIVENPRWSVWRLVGQEGPEPAVEQRVGDVRLRELRAMSYPAYLATPEWRATRAATLRRAGTCCQLDARHAGPFDVHHNTYERLGVELAGDLVVLCRPCHRRVHEPEAARSAPVGAVGQLPPAPGARPSLLRRLLSR